jgi:hypothetical protein
LVFTRHPLPLPFFVEIYLIICNRINIIVHFYLIFL